MVCAALGHPLIITMAESFSVERRKVMRALGAKVILTPAAGRGIGMVKKAREIAESINGYLPHQFLNPNNWRYHAQTTGAEILSDFAGERLDWFVNGYGTGGTFSGVSSVLRAARPDVKLALSEPSGAALVASGKAQKRESDGNASESHPAFSGPHPIQGWTPDFIPKVLEIGLQNKPDAFVQVGGPESMAMALRLAREEGIFTGVSGGASVMSALQVAEIAEPESHILCILADTQERYISGALYQDIATVMSDEEIALSKSTPGFQLEIEK